VAKHKTTLVFAALAAALAFASCAGGGGGTQQPQDTSNGLSCPIGLL